jgi:predicted nucleotidyltransferase
MALVGTGAAVDAVPIGGVELPGAMTVENPPGGLYLAISTLFIANLE